MNPKNLTVILHLSDQDLLKRVESLAEREREATVDLIIHLAELDKRRLYLQEGYSSMFAYCTLVLHMSEYAAYARIEAARIAREFPVILEMLEDGSVNLTMVGLLAKHLTEENYEVVLEEARHKSKRQIEELRARLDPQPPVPTTVRRLPTTLHAAGSPNQLETAAIRRPMDDGRGAELSTVPLVAPALHQPRPAVVVPLAPERYKVQFTASTETYEKLRLAQKLLRREIPTGDPAAIFDRALTSLLQDLAKTKLATTSRPREGRRDVSNSRHIPAEVKREVWLRDGGCCAFVSGHGRRCTEQDFLEFHHVIPYAAGGQSRVENIQLRCRAHNVYEAELAFGPRNRPVVGESPGPTTSL